MPTYLFFILIIVTCLICFFFEISVEDRKGLTLFGKFAIFLFFTGMILILITEKKGKLSIIKEEYPICEVTVTRDVFGTGYEITYQEKNGESSFVNTRMAFPSDEPERLALCDYRFLFLRTEKYVYFTNFEELDAN